MSLGPYFSNKQHKYKPTLEPFSFYLRGLGTTINYSGISELLFVQV